MARASRASRSPARKGVVVAAFMVGLDDEIFVIASSGTVIRMSVREISSQGRDATGVRVMNLGTDELVASVAPGARRPRTDPSRARSGPVVPDPVLPPTTVVGVGASRKVRRRDARCDDVVRGQRGQVLPLVAVIVVVAAGAALVLARLGTEVIDRARARTAADAAALAGVTGDRAGGRARRPGRRRRARALRARRRPGRGHRAGRELPGHRPGVARRPRRPSARPANRSGRRAGEWRRHGGHATVHALPRGYSSVG